MKLNIANPQSGLQKTVEVDDEKKLLPFFEKRMGAEVTADSIGSEFNGYVFRVSGGNDKQGFPMMQGVLANHRVRLLFTKGMKCFRPRRKGEKKRKSVRGCIVGPDLAVLNLVMVKRGDEEIPGLTDSIKPRRLGPKRASNIKKLFNLSKNDDVSKYVVRREIEGKAKKKSKAPKIQRLITKTRIQRKRRERSISRRHAILSRERAEEYKKLVANWKHEQKEKQHRHAQLSAAPSSPTKASSPEKPSAATAKKPTAKANPPSTTTAKPSPPKAASEPQAAVAQKKPAKK